MLPSLTSTAACRVRAWESLASSAARTTICSASWLSARFSGRHCGPPGPGSGCMRNTLRETGPDQAAQRRTSAGHGTLRHLGDTPCDLDICDMRALKGEHRRCADIPDRKATPMLPEATLPKRSPGPAALAGPWVMTPLFYPPGGSEPDAARPRPAGRRRPAPPRRAGRRPSAGQAAPLSLAGKAPPPDDAADLLAITSERLRRALWRSFLR